MRRLALALATLAVVGIVATWYVMAWMAEVARDMAGDDPEPAWPARMEAW